MIVLFFDVLNERIRKGVALLLRRDTEGYGENDPALATRIVIVFFLYKVELVELLLCPLGPRAELCVPAGGRGTQVLMLRMITCCINCDRDIGTV